MSLARAAFVSALVLVSVAGCGGGGGTPPPVPQCANDLPASCPAPAPSWSQAVEPVIVARCQRCHTVGGQAQNRLLMSYADVYSQRSSVLNQVYACKMPPAAEPRPTTAEREALLGWLVCGAPDN